MKSEWKWLENKDVDEAAPVELPRYAPVLSALLEDSQDGLVQIVRWHKAACSEFYLSACLFVYNTNNSLGRIGVALFVFLCETLKYILTTYSPSFPWSADVRPSAKSWDENSRTNPSTNSDYISGGSRLWTKEGARFYFMYALESQFSDDESDVDPALKMYNEAMSRIATLSDVKEVEPLTFRLTSNWEEATKSEKMLCKEKVDEAWRAVCSVIAPNASKELLDAFKLSSSPGSDLTALVTAYRNAPNRGLKTQILSIYVLRYSSTELKQIHCHYKLRITFYSHDNHLQDRITWHDIAFLFSTYFDLFHVNQHTMWIWVTVRLRRRGSMQRPSNLGWVYWRKRHTTESRLIW